MRLNPNIPWKTRGNAALSARFGRGRGPSSLIGTIGGRPVRAFARGRAGPRRAEAELTERLWSALLRVSRRGEDGTDPAMVVAPRQVDPRLYWAAVRRVVEPAEAARAVARAGGSIHAEGSQRGVVGAAASIAWPRVHPTWELIAYRATERVGTRRAVEARSIHALERDHPELFLCSDPSTRRLLVAPHTACPILFGLRSTEASILPRLLPRVRSEPVERWMTFVTNQGTGDHLSRRGLAEVGPYESGLVRGRVARPPEVLRGGHVRLDLEDGEGRELPCVVFEPTKTLPRVARALVAGDVVRLWGGRGEDPVFRVEGIVLESLRPRFDRSRPPRCAACGQATSSLGTARGYRCRRCGTRHPPEAGRGARRTPEFAPGAYHPTPSARRHLAPRGPGPPTLLRR